MIDRNPGKFRSPSGILHRGFRGLLSAWRSYEYEARFQNKRVYANSQADWESIQHAPALFVLSTGRAGTLMLTRALMLSPRLWVEHAPKPDLAHQSYLLYRDLPPIDAQRWAFLHARLHILARVLGAGLCYVETNNRISMYAPAIAELLPNARFIHLIRHPAEFVRSGMRRGYYASMPAEQSGHIEPRPGDTLFAQWSRMKRPEKIAWQWNEINSCIESFKQSVNGQRILTITSTELFSDKDVFPKIFNFAGAELPAISRLRTIQAVAFNQQRNGSYPHFDDWSAQQRDTLFQFAPLAAKYGFDLRPVD